MKSISPVLTCPEKNNYFKKGHHAKILMTFAVEFIVDFYENQPVLIVGLVVITYYALEIKGSEIQLPIHFSKLPSISAN